MAPEVVFNLCGDLDRLDPGGITIDSTVLLISRPQLGDMREQMRMAADANVLGQCL